MRNRIVPIIGLLLAACGSSGSPSEETSNRAPDSGAPDSGAPDSGAPDSGAPDNGSSDSGAPDSGSPGGQNVENVGSGPESCSAVVDQYAASCAPDDYTMNDCEDLRTLYVGEGCGDVWAKYASCAASSTPDCEEGDFPSCRKNFGELFQCQSAWVARTGCTRLTAQDASCPEETPYAVGCLKDPPSAACTTIEEGVHCCP